MEKLLTRPRLTRARLTDWLGVRGGGGRSGEVRGVPGWGAGQGRELGQCCVGSLRGIGREWVTHFVTHNSRKDAKRLTFWPTVQEMVMRF